MKSLIYVLVSIGGVMFLSSCSDNPSQDRVVEERLQQFYSETASSGEVMNEPIPKYSVVTGKRVYPNAFLRLNKSSNASSKLTQSAQVKATPEFRKHYCRTVLAKHFPGLSCEEAGVRQWSASKPNDQPEDLLDGWVDQVERDLDKLPTEGTVSTTPWSDDYWQIRYGATSYRYATKEKFLDYSTAVGAYAQPQEWEESFSKLKLKELSKLVNDWAPAEKYNLSVGDTAFSLTNEQKKEGEDLVGSKGDVEEWMGICHGWTAASMMVPAPMKPVSFVGAEGVKVNWFPHDIRAMASLAWANGDVQNNYIGGRCNVREPEFYPNRRVKQQECFDNNPATFHLTLANQIGLAKASLVMDVAFDYEVWNQPLQSYRFTYFNPLHPEKKSRNWKEVVVPYDEAFQSKDRFQQPPTRGKKVDAVVGVLAEVVYVGEVSPSHSTNPQDSKLVKATYQYDLELEEKDGAFVPTGGEWHTNYHPDFLWVPRKGTVAELSVDKKPLNFTGSKMPSELVTETAKKQVAPDTRYARYSRS